MERPGIRRSDRIYVELDLQVTGTDGTGRAFMDNTRTLVVAHHGAKIVLNRQLAPEQEVTLRCIKTGLESPARIVGQIGSGEEGHYYGIELLESNVNLWGIDFPPITEAELAVGRVLLECVHCHSQELAYLDVFEVEVLEANDYLSRSCNKCGDSTVWKKPTAKEVGDGVSHGATTEVPEAAVSRRTQNDRKFPRVDLKIDVCIRSEEHGEEVAVTEDVSRGGFRFKSDKRYIEGTLLEVSVPYAPSGANVFAPAKIVYCEDLSPEKKFAYGVMYISAREASPSR